MLEEKRNNKPDVVLKKYWENKERFSDFFNAVLFDGKTVIRPEELEDLDTDESSILEHKNYAEIIYVFLTIFLYLLKCPQSLILSALRAFCFCGKPRISRSIFLYFPCQSWLKSW